MNIVLQLLYSYIITRCSQKSYYESNYLQEIIRIASPSPKPLVHPSPNPSRSTDSSTHCGIRFRISTFSSSTFESFEKKTQASWFFETSRCFLCSWWFKNWFLLFKCPETWVDGWRFSRSLIGWNTWPMASLGKWRRSSNATYDQGGLMMCHVVHVYMTNEYHTVSQNS